MSLLLDALKKTEAADTVQGAPTRTGAPELTLETLPQAPQEKTEQEAEDDLARLSARQLFAAKPARPGIQLGIVPIALITALLLALAGGYYVWREISPAPMAMPQPPAPSAVANTAPAMTVQPAAVPATPDLPVAAAIAQSTGVPIKHKHGAIKHARAAATSSTATPTADILVATPATSALNATAADAAQPIRIQHGQESASIDPALMAGYQAYRNGDLAGAGKHYGDVLRKDSKNRDALLGLAAIAMQQSQDDIAARYYRQVLALDPRDPIAQAGMSALFGASDMAGTESRLKLLLRQNPQSAALHFALGNHYADQSRWSEAQHAYFEAASLDRNDGRFAFNLAVSLDHLGQRKLAAQYYREALKLSTAGNSGFDRAQTEQRANELSAP